MEAFPSIRLTRTDATKDENGAPQYSQSAPPNTQLFINDYSTTDPKRLECLISVVARLRWHGVPLDGVGHEMHNHIDNPSPVAMLEAIETLARLFPHLHQQVARGSGPSGIIAVHHVGTDDQGHER